jgi:hypothetical protein
VCGKKVDNKQGPAGRSTSLNLKLPLLRTDRETKPYGYSDENDQS